MRYGEPTLIMFYTLVGLEAIAFFAYWLVIFFDNRRKMNDNDQSILSIQAIDEDNILTSPQAERRYSIDTSNFDRTSQLRETNRRSMVGKKEMKEKLRKTNLKEDRNLQMQVSMLTPENRQLDDSYINGTNQARTEGSKSRTGSSRSEKQALISV